MKIIIPLFISFFVLFESAHCLSCTYQLCANKICTDPIDTECNREIADEAEQLLKQAGVSLPDGDPNKSSFECLDLFAKKDPFEVHIKGCIRDSADACNEALYPAFEHQCSKCSTNLCNLAVRADASFLLLIFSLLVFLLHKIF